MQIRQIARAKQVLGLLGRTRQEVPFFYSAAGPMGVPVLLIEPEVLDETEVFALIGASQRKSFARGTISRDTDGALVFYADARGARQLAASLVGSLEEMIPGMRFARVQVSASNPTTDGAGTR